MDNRTRTVTRSGVFKMEASQYLGQPLTLQQRVLQTVWSRNPDSYSYLSFINQAGNEITPSKVIFKYTFDEDVVEIKVGEVPLTELIDELFLPKELKRIGPATFAGIDKIQSIILPPTLEYIGQGVFAGAVKLKEIIIPNTINFIGAEAFYGNISADIYLPPVFFEVEDNAFLDVKTLHYSGSLPGAPWGAQEWIQD